MAKKNYFLCAFVFHSFLYTAPDAINKPEYEINTYAIKEPNIIFTTAGLADFFKDKFNNVRYTTPLEDLVLFINHGTRTNQNPEYFSSVIKLFRNRVGGSLYLGAWDFDDFLSSLPATMGKIFISDIPTGDELYKKTINDILYSRFLSSFDEFKVDPAFFFDTLSHQIFNTINSDILAQERTRGKKEALQKSVVNFLDRCIGKLAWNPQDHEELWTNIKSINAHIGALVEHQIINDLDDLDDLGWTLTYRFAYFLDLMALDLPIEFYQKIKDDVVCHRVPLFEIEEQEEFMLSKKDYLLGALMTHEARARAYKEGIIT